jgi:hypothetical protein
VSINKFSVGLPWLHQNCYDYYVRQQKVAPEDTITISTIYGQSISNVAGPTSSQNDTSLVAVSLNISDASPTGTNLSEALGSRSWNIAGTEVFTTPNNNAYKGSVELSDKENTSISGSTATDTNASNATGEVSSSILGGGCPKGTKKESKVTKGEALIGTKNWCAMEYYRAKHHRLTIEKKKQAEKGLLEKLMLQASRKFDSPLSDLKIGTIQG